MTKTSFVTQSATKSGVAVDFLQVAAYASPCLGKKTGAGIGVLMIAAKSRSVFRSAAFLRLVAPSMGGPGGRAARLAGAIPVRQSRSVPPTPIGVVVRGSSNELEIATMSASKGASAPRVTKKLPFVRANSAGHMLFEVRAGVRSVDALEMASCYLAAARDSAAQMADDLSEHGLSDAVWQAYYLIEIAKAALDASIGIVVDEERGHV